MAADSLPKLAALERNQEALLGFISQHAEIIDELYENELITEEAMDSFEPPMVLHAVCEMVKEDPRNFDRFCDILGPDSEIVMLLKSRFMVHVRACKWTLLVKFCVMSCNTGDRERVLEEKRSQTEIPPDTGRLYCVRLWMLNLGVHLAVKRLIECSEIIMRGTMALDSAVELGKNPYIFLSIYFILYFDYFFC